MAAGGDAALRLTALRADDPRPAGGCWGCRATRVRTADGPDEGGSYTEGRPALGLSVSTGAAGKK